MNAPLLLLRVAAMGHKVFTTGNLNLNIIGIRTSEVQAGAFDDWMTVTFRRDDAWVTRWWRCTTDPGRYYLERPDRWMNEKGVAGLVPDQYRSVYKIGLHGKSQYEALCQRNGPVKVYRDNDGDDQLDYDPATIQTGSFGINIHASSSSPYEGDKDRTGDRVGAWSAGCQVFARECDFREFMGLCRESRTLWGELFTYTLITEAHLQRTLA